MYFFFNILCLISNSTKTIRLLAHDVYLTISRRRRGDYKPIFTEPKCFSINFQAFTKKNQHNFIKIHFRKKNL